MLTVFLSGATSAAHAETWLQEPEFLEDFIEPEKAPFGLDWGMPMKDLTLPVRGNCQPENSYLTVCQTEKLPHSLPQFSQYELHFYRDSGLLFIKAVSDNIENDPRGQLGRKKFIQLEDALRVRYPDSALTRNSFLSKQRAKVDEFYSCLQNYSCGRHEAELLHRDGSLVRLRLTGGLLNTGNLVLEYQTSDYASVVEYLQKFIDLEKLHNIDATKL